MQQVLDPNHWLNSFPPAPGWAIFVALIAFVVWTIVSSFVYIRRRQLFAGNGALIGMGTRFGWYAISIGIVGLLLILARYVQLPYVDMPLILLLDSLLAVGFLIFLIYSLRRRYPARLAAVRAHELRRHYAPERRRRKRRA